MNLLLDTHVWLWTLEAPEKISPTALEALSNTENALYLSAASSWEIAIKYKLGKLPLPEPPAQFIPPRITRDGIIPLSVDYHHSLLVATLPDHHSDPFDRILICQAIAENLILVTHDKIMQQYDLTTIYA